MNLIATKMKSKSKKHKLEKWNKQRWERERERPTSEKKKKLWWTKRKAYLSMEVVVIVEQVIACDASVLRGRKRAIGGESERIVFCTEWGVLILLFLLRIWNFVKYIKILYKNNNISITFKISYPNILHYKKIF